MKIAREQPIRSIEQVQIRQQVPEAVVENEKRAEGATCMKDMTAILHEKIISIFISPIPNKILITYDLPFIIIVQSKSVKERINDLYNYRSI